tara:strand:- start:170 stop:463 length:294 start_codon:yes stop_codon:yes gene_type:complete
MTFDEYQRLSARTSAMEWGWPQDKAVANATIGLCGEAGEVAEHIKKREFHGKDAGADALKAELGDVLWYVAELATLHGMTLGDVAASNVAKLEERYL